jgi:hypothetical protein
MSKNKTGRILLGLAVAGVGIVGATALQRAFSDDAEAEGAKHAVNRVWIERLPNDQRDMISHFVLVDHQRGRIGGIGKSSQWRHFVELFQWGLEGERLSIFLPQDRVKAQLTVKTWGCAGEAPDPFELCMEISNGKRSAKFYSRKDWVIEPHDVEGSVAELVEDAPELAGILDAVPTDGAGESTPDAADWAEADILK